MNRHLSINIFIKKAAVSACLLLFCSGLQAQHLLFGQRTQAAYYSAISLDPETALSLGAAENSVADTYVVALAEALELIVTEDQAKFNVYEERFLRRLDKKLKASPADDHFLQAEIRLQWAFVYLKFGHELDAALRLREAYQIAQSCRNKFPEYLPIRKTNGLLQVIVGSVPEKYNWVLGLLNMSGSLSTGLNELKAVADCEGPLSLEGKILHALVQGFILSRPEDGLKEMQQLLTYNIDNRLVLFLSASLALKSGSNEIALRMLKGLSVATRGIPLYYGDYLRGEAFLHKADYTSAIHAYQWFINHQPGHNYIKDAYYKIGLCHWLGGNKQDALKAFAEARQKGSEATDADKSAARSLAEERLPNIKLSKVRYLTDGGYYEDADRLLATISGEDLTERKDEVEYYYRRARLAHRMNRPEAIELYLKTVEMAGQENWYFAPNACLQLGYLYQSENRAKDAAEYFRRAMAYRRHEYKNSIDSKARSALAQLGRI